MPRTLAGLFVVLAVVPCLAQSRRFGLELKAGGAPSGWFTDTIGRESATDNSWRATLGPAFQVRLSDKVAIEAAGFYRRVRRHADGGYLPFSEVETGTGWEFPLAGKLTLSRNVRGFRPFVVAGPSVRRLHTSTQTRWTALVADPVTGSPVSVPRSATVSVHDWNVGPAVGGGLEHRLGPMRVSIDARYTRWPAGHRGPNGCFIRCVEQNQFQFLWGAGF